MTREPFDYGECRKRLRSVTTDAEIIASLDRVAECSAAGDSEAFDDQARMDRTDNALEDFLGDALQLNISLDYIFGGRGEPFMSPGVAA